MERMLGAQCLVYSYMNRGKKKFSRKSCIRPRLLRQLRFLLSLREIRCLNRIFCGIREWTRSFLHFTPTDLPLRNRSVIAVGTLLKKKRSWSKQCSSDPKPLFSKSFDPRTWAFFNNHSYNILCIYNSVESRFFRAGKIPSWYGLRKYFVGCMNSFRHNNLFILTLLFTFMGIWNVKIYDLHP